MKMTKDDIVAHVRREIENSQGYDSDVLADKRAQALNMYHGKMAAAPEGRSQIISFDVADTVHNLLAQVGPIFQTSLINFVGESEEDEPQAQLESDFCCYQLERSGGYNILSEAAFDALLQGNGWLKVSVDEQMDVATEHYGELDPLQLHTVSQATDENQNVVVTETSTGYSVRRENTTRTLIVECISPDVMIFAADSGQFKLDELRFVGERKLFTSSDLRELGVSQADIDTMPDSLDDYWTAARAREGIYQDQTGAETASQQDAEALKECFDTYVRLDLNDDGYSELRHVMMGGEVLILDEPAEFSPYATGSPVPLPHRIQGTGMYELMGSVQESKTAVMRNFIDNLEVLNGSRVGAVEGDVNMKDLTTGRLNGVVRLKNAQAIVPLPAADIGMQAVTGLNYLDSVRSQRGGSSVDMNEGDKQVMASSAMAASGMMAAAEKMAGWYSHNLVNTLLKTTYQLIHRTLRTQMPGETGAKLRGKWVQTDPAQWKDRQHIEVTAGMTTTERNQKIQGLSSLMQQQAAAMQQGGGGVITDHGKIYNAAADWIRASEIGAPDEYLIDPDSEEAKQAQQQAAQQQQQDKQEAKAEREQVLRIEQEKIAQDRYKTDEELKFKYWDAGLKAEIDEAKMTTDAVVKLETAGSEDEDGTSKGIVG